MGWERSRWVTYRSEPGRWESDVLHRLERAGLRAMRGIRRDNDMAGFIILIFELGMKWRGD